MLGSYSPEDENEFPKARSMSVVGSHSSVAAHSAMGGYLPWEVQM